MLELEAKALGNTNTKMMKFVLKIRNCNDLTGTLGLFETSPKFSDYNDLTPSALGTNWDMSISYVVNVYPKLLETTPWFEFPDMTYFETFDGITNRRPNCPITYSHSSPNFDIIYCGALCGACTMGVDCVMRVKLKDALKEIPGTYGLVIVGKALGNSITNTITFTLILKDYCNEYFLAGNLLGESLV